MMDIWKRIRIETAEKDIFAYSYILFTYQNLHYPQRNSTSDCSLRDVVVANVASGC